MKKIYLSLLFSCLAWAGFPQVSTFLYSGGPQTYIVPPSIYALSIDIRGAKGGGITCAYTDYQSIGGCGGRVQAVLAVSPGQALRIIVGGQGISTSGTGGYGGGGTDDAYDATWPGAGGGGGTSIVDITSGAMMAVAGGGGGGGGGWCLGSGTYSGLGDAGGAGGGLTGAPANCDACGLALGGQGGTPVAGGAAGSCLGDAGLPGSAGIGGNYTGALGSGGGGGGWFGGGSGGYGGGGGGGSSYTNPLFAYNVVHTQGYDCGNGMAIIYEIPLRAVNNHPCLLDTLKLDAEGDSTGATYLWTGPGGFTSTLQNPFIYPAEMADTGLYTVYKTIAGVSDTSTTEVVVHPKFPVTVTSNAPLCAGLVDTLRLTATPDSSGETFTWTGPNSFTSTLQLPIIPGFAPADTGAYMVITKSAFGCLDTGFTDVGIVPPPRAPIITGTNRYCQGDTFIPFVLDSVSGTVLWYPTATGGVGSTTASVVNTGVPGIFKVWASQVIGSCESPRDSFVVRVTTTPPAPGITGGLQYCQFIGPFVPLTLTTTATGTALWYTVATGGTSSLTEPSVNINIAGTYNSWVSQIDSGCEGPRAPVSIVVHPKPAPPVISGQGPYCQFKVTAPLIATVSEAGDFLTWYGKGLPLGGSLLTPSPQYDTAFIDTYYVDETSVYGCVSDSSTDTVRIIPKPMPPHVTDTAYCQFTQAMPLNYDVDSAVNSYLKWYQGAIQVPVPTPSTTTPGLNTWYVSQVVQTCESDSTPVQVTTIYLPQFTISTVQSWVCERDSISLVFNGAPLTDAGYLWTLPYGDSFANGSTATDSMVYVKFDSAAAYTYIYLKGSDNNGRCFTTDTISISVVPQPSASSYTKADVCLGDTTSLEVGTKTSDASKFAWLIDYTNQLGVSGALNVIAASTNSGGPFSISWTDTGMHVIQLNSFTSEGCASNPSFDTVHVHPAPDATFKIETLPNTLCIEDSVEFIANAGGLPDGYNYSYSWSPAHSFNNVNQPTAWGKVETSTTIITLTVTDPFGCVATSSFELDPGSCCTVAFPNAFTPNGDGHNDVFRPLYTGYHNFHVFRIQNRWGQTVYESTNSNLKWDGTFNGVPQDMGVYFYYIKYDCGGKTIEESGDVTLIR